MKSQSYSHLDAQYLGSHRFKYPSRIWLIDVQIKLQSDYISKKYQIIIFNNSLESPIFLRYKLEWSSKQN